MRQYKRKVPVLSDNEIDIKAEELLKNYATDFLSEPQMLDVEDFAEFYLGYSIYYTQLSNSGFIWGNMVFQDSFIFKYDAENNAAGAEFVYANTIAIEDRISSQEHALRSTIAHEIGHGIFHKDYFCVIIAQDSLHFLLKTAQMMLSTPNIAQLFVVVKAFRATGMSRDDLKLISIGLSIKQNISARHS